MPGSLHPGLPIVLAVAVSALSADCAGRAPVRDVSQTADVEPLIRQGCYSCLEAAFRLASAAGARTAAFEASVLLTLRSKELGLPFADWLERARALAPANPGWSDYVRIAEAVPADPLSADRDAILLTRRPARTALDEWRALLAAGPGSPVFRTYLDLSLVCGPALVDDREQALTHAIERFDGVPLVAYRAGICGRTTLLDDLARQDGQFPDVHLELGRARLQRERPDYDEALAHLDRAHTAFPTSATIIAMIGAIRQQREEWAEALAAYEATLALVSTHRDALLGAAISLSYLTRHDDAIVPASRLLELGSWFIADAYYWRAWNEYRLGRIEAARADVDRSRALSREAPTLVLSGIIAWRERRLDAADAEFQEALNLDFGQCEAATYLGGVRAEQRRWQESLAAFQHAAQCFELAVITRRKALAELIAGVESVSGVARQVASHQRAIAEAETRRAEAVASIASIEPRITPYTGGETEQAPSLPGRAD